MSPGRGTGDAHRMRAATTSITAALVAAALVAGCASTPEPTQRRPDYFNHDYEFSGTIQGQSISGSILFVENDVYPLEYVIASDQGLCRGSLRQLTLPGIQLGCGGLTFEFVRDRRIPDRSRATLRTTREVVRRECSNWVVEPTTGRRTCGSWRSVPYVEPVTLSGWVQVRRTGT